MKPSHTGPVVGQRAELTAIDCKQCGYIHLDKFPDPAALAKFYESDFWQTYKAGAREVFEAERDWLAAMNGDWLELVERHSALNQTNLLDVGAGYGYFMAEARARGWQPRGIELSAEAAKYAAAYGDISPLAWERYGYVGFDCISALWLIEHLPNPAEFLYWCYAHLNRSGVLLIACPNDFSAIQYEANGYVKNLFYWLDQTHINYFTPSSLSNLLGRCGFRIVERTTLWPMEEHLIRGDDYTADSALGARLHAMIRTEDLQMTREERIKFYGDMASEGRGRELIYVAVKE